jgi:hypothetical protein
MQFLDSPAKNFTFSGLFTPGIVQSNIGSFVNVSLICLYVR